MILGYQIAQVLVTLVDIAQGREVAGLPAGAGTPENTPAAEAPAPTPQAEKPPRKPRAAANTSTAADKASGSTSAAEASGRAATTATTAGSTGSSSDEAALRAKAREITLKQLVPAVKRDGAVALLAHFGGTSASDIPVDNLQPYIDAAERVIAGESLDDVIGGDDADDLG